jgi:hypothetical protein
MISCNGAGCGAGEQGQGLIAKRNGRAAVSGVLRSLVRTLFSPLCTGVRTGDLFLAIGVRTGVSNTCTVVCTGARTGIRGQMSTISSSGAVAGVRPSCRAECASRSGVPGAGRPLA